MLQFQHIRVNLTTSRFLQHTFQFNDSLFYQLDAKILYFNTFIFLAPELFF